MHRPKQAGTAEILRASQKDEEYLRYVKNLFSDIVQRNLGIPYWIKCKDFCSTLCDAAFFSLTTLSGLQTLGEEYVNIIQVDRSLKSVPSKWARFSDITLRTFGYYFLLRYQTWLENRLSSISSSIPSDGNNLVLSIKSYLPIIFKMITVFQRLHLIAFYFYGNYYSIAKRLTGINYVVIRKWLSNPDQQTLYKLIGWLALSQLCLSLALTLYNANSTTTVPEEKKNKISDEPINSKNQCSLCFEKRRNSTATPCGHVFCWSCITSWMQNKEECPLCREPFPASKLIFLQNYF